MTADIDFNSRLKNITTMQELRLLFDEAHAKRFKLRRKSDAEEVTDIIALRRNTFYSLFGYLSPRVESVKIAAIHVRFHFESLDGSDTYTKDRPVDVL